MKSDVQLFNSQEAAKILGVNVSTVKRWTDSGKLKCIKSPGGHRKFQMSHLAEFLEENKKKTTKVNLFPLETETDLRLSRKILKGDFSYLNGYVEKQAMNCNRDKVQQVLNGLYLAQYPLYIIYDQLITPILHRLGDSWENGSVSVTQEHLASQTIRDAVIRLQGIIKIPRNKTGKVLCLNFSSELHDMALKMADHLLELRGFRVFYSGPITPIIQLPRIFESHKPDRTYISSTIVENPETTQAEFNRLCEICTQYKSRLYVGGRGFDRLNFDHPAVVRRLFTFEEVHSL